MRTHYRTPAERGLTEEERDEIRRMEDACRVFLANLDHEAVAPRLLELCKEDQHALLRFAFLCGWNAQEKHAVFGLPIIKMLEQVGLLPVPGSD